MIDDSRHVPLRDMPWDPDAAKEAIAEIAADAFAHFGPDPFWPGHPLDDQRRHCGIYYGAAGVVWGLDYLQRIRAIKADFDFKPHLQPLLVNIQADMTAYRDYAAHGSFLAGDMGTALVAMRLAPSDAMAELVYTRAEANTHLPIRELMWGLPGSMLACLVMSEMTHERAGGRCLASRPHGCLPTSKTRPMARSGNRTFTASMQSSSAQSTATGAT